MNPRLFTQGLPVEPHSSLTIPLRRAGRQVDFNFCDFDLIVAPATVNAVLQEIAGQAIQRIPVSVPSAKGDFEILNVCELVQCIDESRSMLTEWTEADGRAEKTGQLRMVVKLHVDARAAAGHHVFRLAGWPIALIVSEDVKHALEAMKVSGLKYDRVG